MASLLLGVVAALKRKTAGPHSFRWMCLSAIFLYMSVDEAVGLHELLTEPTRRLLGLEAKGVLYFAWVIPGMVVGAALALWYWTLLLSLPTRTKWQFVLAAVLFVGGAIGMELVGGVYYRPEGATLAYSVVSTIEETLEMAGVIVFINALLRYLAEQYRECRVTFRES